MQGSRLENSLLLPIPPHPGSGVLALDGQQLDVIATLRCTVDFNILQTTATRFDGEEIWASIVLRGNEGVICTLPSHIIWPVEATDQLSPTHRSQRYVLGFSGCVPKVCHKVHRPQGCCITQNQ